MATRAQIEAEIATYTANLQTLNERYDAAQSAGDTALAAQLARARAAAERLLAGAERELAALLALPPTTTAADEVAGAGVATTVTTDATTTNANTRLTAAQAAALANGSDSGTDTPVKTLAETQSVPAQISTAATNTVSNAAPVSGGTPGAGATPDAVPGISASNTAQIINSFSNIIFTPKDNVLDRYASYTYSISWYLMPPTLYQSLLIAQKINLPSGNLLVQSGGAPTPVNGQGRNQFFGLDYYIDDLSITSAVTGAGTGRAHNATEMSFSITEPAGITLIDNLWSAVKLAYGRPDILYASAMYAMVIRFYGYDNNGLPITASDSDNNNSVVEKIIPFRIRNITFRVANKLVEYKVEAVAIPYSVGFSTNLGVIKAPIEITGGTVKDLLTNGVLAAVVSPDDGIPTTPNPNTNPITNTDSNTTGNGGIDTSTALVGA